MMRQRMCFCVLCAALAALLAVLLYATPSATAAEPAGKTVSFIKDVAPILKDNCLSCHDAKKRKGKLDMSTFEAFRKGGTKDDPIVPGKPDDSYLMDVLTAKDASRMPPKESGDPLSTEQIGVIRAWISQGAKLDGGLKPQADLLRELRSRWEPPAPPAAYKYPVTITALAFTPDGKQLVVGGHHELTVWDAAEGKLLKRIYTRAERAYAMLFLSDGLLVVAGGRPGQEGDVRVFDINGGKPKMMNDVALLDGVHDNGVMVKQLLEADDSVLCLALSADGKKLASGGCDRLVNVWDLSGGVGKAKLEQSIENHADWVFDLTFATDGKHLLSASRDKTAKVWDLAAKESVLTFPGHQAPVYGVAVKADGKIGYSVGEDKQVRSWNTSGDGKQVRAQGGHSNTIHKIVMSPKDAVLATCAADNSIRLWDADRVNNTRTLTGHTDYVYALAFSPDGKTLASGAWNGEVRVWKVADGSLVKTFNASPGLPAPSAAAAKP